MNTTPFTLPPATIVFFDLHHWPLWVAAAFMLIAAVANYRTLRVPNQLTLAAILSACLVGLLLSAKLIEGAAGSFASVLVSMFVGGLFLIPFYAIGYLGAGCVKMQAAYGAWLGCAFPLQRAAFLVCITSVVGALFCVAVGLIVWLIVRNRLKDSDQTMLLPGQELLSAGSVISLAVWLQFVG